MLQLTTFLVLKQFAKYSHYMLTFLRAQVVTLKWKIKLIIIIKFIVGNNTVPLLYMPFLGLTFSFWMLKLWMFWLLFHLIIYILDENSWVWDHRGLTHLKALVATVKYKLNLAVMELLCYYFCILSLAHKYFFTCFVYWYVIRWLQLNRSQSYNSW